MALQPAIAASQDAIAPPPAVPVAPPTPPEDDAENTGADFARPLNLFQLTYSYRTAPGSGAEPGTIREVTTDTVNLRTDYRIDLGSQWTLGLRADLPFLAKNPLNSSNPDGDYLYGVGDADAQAALIYKFDTRWSVGFGARLFFPTGSDVIASGKWQVMPAFGVRYALPEVSPGSYLEPVLWYDASFAGDPSKKNISNLQFAPTLNLALPDRWFVTLYPSADIRVNYGDPVTGQTGRLFLPFDARVGRKLTDSVTLSVEIGAPIIKDYPVYSFKTQVRLNLTF